ncbi:MAG: hypothetical protein P4L85_16570 [Paludisphaera borealis]|uniref:hypothetical protein n=1 Tax=Paludisphaera borealis TaxID=1387353 RepID=UPI0028425637|nr:hypothetical protein [Paludisphaera borealis]MDR3620968.1 hypothetical protein [Paludisphaera borealis]
MKRTFAVVALLAALGVLAKLAVRPVAVTDRSGTAGVDVSARAPVDGEAAPGPSPEDDLLARYREAPAEDRELVARTVERYRRNAVAIERSDGLRGLKLLDRLDLEAVFLFEKHPTEFRRLRDMLSDDAAADLLLHWREYFGMKRADETDRKLLIAELQGLTPLQRRMAAKYPSALPLILAEPAGVAELMAAHQADESALVDHLVILSLISLENGAADVRSALRTIDDHPALAVDAFRRYGLEGFALVSLYGPVLEALGAATTLDESLILLRVNTDYVDELLQTHRPETVARHLRHVKAVGLVREVGGSPNALRLAVEFGASGEKALAKAGPDAADVVFGDFADPTLRNQAVAALGDHGAMALAMLDKYATDPDFREILRLHGGAIIPPIAQADAGPETLALLQSKPQRSFTESLAKTALSLSGDDGQTAIRMIQADGLERVASLSDQELRYYQFLPLYDMLHLGNVLRHGQSPTTGEAAWALLDGCFVVADVLSLAAIQPEAAVAVEAARTEVKAAVRESARSAGRELIEAAAPTTAKGLARTEAGDLAARRLSRWWTVRSAGGVYQLMRRTPEALPRMTLAQLAATARPLCAKAGLRLSLWNPVHLLREGVDLTLKIPADRGLKYVAAQFAQAGVGVFGFQKMEEHLASRRPKSPSGS